MKRNQTWFRKENFLQFMSRIFSLISCIKLSEDQQDALKKYRVITMYFDKYNYYYIKKAI